MKKRLSRKQARASLILLAVGAVGILLWSATYWNAAFWIGLVIFVSGILAAGQPCPFCGKFIRVRLSWSGAMQEYHCPCCGTRLAYDDEPEEE